MDCKVKNNLLLSKLQAWLSGLLKKTFIFSKYYKAAYER
jgi:hypothetical protein